MKHTIETTLTVLTRVDGLPAPVAEWKFHPRRKWLFDWAWVNDRLNPGLRPGLQLAWEIDGGTWIDGGGRHNRAQGFEDDCRKTAWAAILGWRVIRTTTRMVETGEALALLGRALRGDR